MARVKYYNQTSGKWEYADEVQAAPVQSVNGKTGAVTLSASDVGAEKTGAVAALEAKALLKSDILIKKAKLTLENGTEVLVDVVVASEGTVVETYTNQIPISKDASGAVYNGTGWKGAYRLSGSAGTEKTEALAAVCGFIPVKSGDVVRMKYEGTGAVWDENGTASSNNVVAYYKADHSWLGSVTPQPSNYGICTASDAPTGTLQNGGIVTINVPNNSNIAYMRMSSVANPASLEGMILTVNEEIPA